MSSTLEASPSTFVGLYESANKLLDLLFEEEPELALALCYEKIATSTKQSFAKSGLVKDTVGSSALRRIHGKLDITNLDVVDLTKLFSASPEIFMYDGKPSFHVSHPLSTDITLSTINTLQTFCKTNELDFILSPNSWLDTGKRFRLTICRPEVLDLFNSPVDDIPKKE